MFSSIFLSNLKLEVFYFITLHLLSYNFPFKIPLISTLWTVSSVFMSINLFGQKHPGHLENQPSPSQMAIHAYIRNQTLRTLGYSLFLKQSPTCGFLKLYSADLSSLNSSSLTLASLYFSTFPIIISVPQIMFWPIFFHSLYFYRVVSAISRP